MTGKKPEVSVRWTVAAIALLFALGAAHAGTINDLNTTPAVVRTSTALLGTPVAVAVDSAGHVYVMSLRGWIFSLSGTFTVVASARLPGPLGAPRPPATALFATDNGDVYAGRSDGMIFRYSNALGNTPLGTATITGAVVGLTVDSAGNVYAANAGGTISKMNSGLASLGTGTVSVAPGASVVAISIDSTGNLFVAISDGTIVRLNTSLTTLATGTVAGTPVDIATDTGGTSGAVIVATSTGLHSITQNIVTLKTLSLTGIVGVDMDGTGDVVAADSAGNIFVMGTGLTAPRSVSTGTTPIRSIAINVTAAIFVVGGPAGASEGDPHVATIDGLRYDFQSAGEFVLFRHTADREHPACGERIDPGESRKGGHDTHDPVEIQVRQFPVATTANTCVSLNAAVAARVGEHTVTYEPNLSGQPDPSGLQLRVDHKLVTLSPSGTKLGDDGRIMPTSTPGGLQVEFPDDSILYVTPGWWASQSKWYLNLNVEPGQRACGLVGAVPEGSWLPALPDGTSLGPKPASLHDQYLQLYGHFADAWRVTDKSSLFDYAPGTSTGTFTMRGWPPESGKCEISGTVPVEGANDEVAKAACKGVPGDPANCIFDVKVTGLANIANTYVASRNVQPAPETQPAECHCGHEAGGGTFALLTFLGMLLLWLPLRMHRRKKMKMLDRTNF